MSKKKILILLKIINKDKVILVRVLTLRTFQENRGHAPELLSPHPICIIRASFSQEGGDVTLVLIYNLIIMYVCVCTHAFAVFYIKSVCPCGKRQVFTDATQI